MLHRFRKVTILAICLLQIRESLSFVRSLCGVVRDRQGVNVPSIVVGTNTSPSSSSSYKLQQSSNSDLVSNDGKADVVSEAAALQQQAKRVRLEAEKLDISLTMKKISDLEKKLEAGKLSSEESKTIQSQLEQLLKKLESPDEVPIPKTKSETSDTSESMLIGDELKLNSNKEAEEEEIKKTIDAWKTLSPIELRIRRLFLNAEDVEIIDIDDFVRTVWNRGSSIRNALKQTDSIAWNLAKVLPSDEERFSSMTNEELKDEFRTSREVFFEVIELEEANERDEVTDEMATGVLEKIFSSSMKDELRRQGVEEDDIDTWVDPRMQPVLNVIPEAALFNKPKDEDVDAFFRLIVSSNTFIPTSKPEKVPGGYIIRGQSKVEGDQLISTIDNAAGHLSEKLNYFFVADPVEKSFDEIRALETQIELGDATMDDLESPLILITGPNITPESTMTIQLLSLPLSLLNVAYFSTTSFGNDSFSVQNILSILLPVLGLQIAHDLGHKVIAWKEKVKTSLPTFVPGGSVGLFGTITEIESPPKNRQTLFDYALSGPLVGISCSFALLIAGLLQTASADNSSTFPAVSVGFLQLSTLAGDIFQQFFGQDIFLATEPDSLIRVHPWVLAAYIGIISNGLNLLPLKITDGGRIVRASLGRTFSKLPESIAFFALFLSGLFGKDELNILVLYACFVSFFVGEKEVPCRNEITDIDNVRGIVGILALLVAVLSVTPLA